MLHDHHRRAVVADFGEEGEGFGDLFFAEAGKGFVVEEQRGLVCHNHTKGEHFAFAAAEVAGGLLAAVLEEREILHHFGDAAGAFLAVLQVQEGELEVFQDGGVVKEFVLLGDILDASVDEGVRGRLQLGVVQQHAIVFHGAFPDVQEAVDHLQQGALAGAVRADEQDRIALFDIQGDIEKHLSLAVSGAGVLDGQQAHT